MAYLDAGASLKTVLSAYETSSVYDLTGDVGLCREHIQACRFLIARTADETRHGGAGLRDNAAKYRASEEKAMGWLASNDPAFSGGSGAGSVRYVSLNGMRDL